MGTSPAYDLIGQWSDYLGQEVNILPLYSSENFRIKVSNLPNLPKPPRMILTVKPGNPCPAGGRTDEWKELIEYCIKNNIRLVNDGAYCGLSHGGSHVSLSQVAKDYKELDWIELFSVSKSMNACGWRVGVAIGSIDFIDELTRIKGNADSGPFGPALAGVSEYLKSSNSICELREINALYKRRLNIMIPMFKKFGFRLACLVDAGFFVLWKCPIKLNGEEVVSSEDFNSKMINSVGLVGVPFSGAEVDGKKEQFIRYTVCSDFENKNFSNRVEDALSKVSIEY